MFNLEEAQYIDLVKKILTSGSRRDDRTGTGTLSLFGAQMRFDLTNDCLPLLTTKRVNWCAIVHELLWMISGCTDSCQLARRGTNIWNVNGSRKFLDSRGFTTRREGDLGPVYGFQWRHFGATYVDCDTNYTGQGIDQLAKIVEQIKREPSSRRIIMSAWNPMDEELMVLPPCHVLAQFYVNGDELSCQLYQRSGDMGLGVPFNIASYSLLTHMLAHVCNLRAKEFIYTLGDAHIYLNHVDQLEMQITREPRAFPRLKIQRTVPTIDDFCLVDFKLIDYTPHSSIVLKMSA